MNAAIVTVNVGDGKRFVFQGGGVDAIRYDPKGLRVGTRPKSCERQ